MSARHFWSGIFLMAIFSGLAGLRAAPPATGQVGVFLIGDSTVNAGVAGKVGWGSVLPALFDPRKVRVENDALGGRSSRSYATDPKWPKVLASLQPGSWLFIQFGHNDSRAVDQDGFVGTLPGNGPETQEAATGAGGQPETVHTYGWYLRRLVAQARARGAMVVLCSPVPRNVWVEGRVLRNKEDYGKWSREVALQTGCAWLDLNELIARRYEALGAEKVRLLFAPADPTHTVETGARLNAECVAQALRGLPDCPLSDFLLPAGAKAPR